MRGSSARLTCWWRLCCVLNCFQSFAAGYCLGHWVSSSSCPVSQLEQNKCLTVVPSTLRTCKFPDGIAAPRLHEQTDEVVSKRQCVPQGFTQERVPPVEPVPQERNQGHAFRTASGSMWWNRRGAVTMQPLSTKSVWWHGAKMTPKSW